MPPNLPPCPMRSQQHPHDAHEWDDGEKHCPGYGEADEFDVELDIPPSRLCRAHDLGLPHPPHDFMGGVCHGVLNRGPLGLTSSAPEGETVDDPANVARLAIAEWEANAYRNQVQALIREMQRMSQEAGFERPVDVIVMDGRPVEDEPEDEPEAETALADARSWARHGYEIGQRHCGWSDHGVAPAWLTEGWPLRIDSCEHAKQAAECDTALTRVRSLPEQPGVIFGERSKPVEEPTQYLLGYKMAIRDAKRAANFTTQEGAGSDAVCCVCGRGDGWAVYRNYKEQAFCWPCADCDCCQDVCVRTGINEKAKPAEPDPEDPS